MCCTQHTVEHPCFQGVPQQSCHRERGLPQLKIKTKLAIGFYSGLKSHIFIIFYYYYYCNVKRPLAMTTVRSLLDQLEPAYT